jgi:histidine triad (HIT) family protein
MRALVDVARGVKRAFGAEGITIRQHNERAGGQDVDHLHFHVVPRFVDDGFPSWGSVRHTTPIERAEFAHTLSLALEYDDV